MTGATSSVGNYVTDWSINCTFLIVTATPISSLRILDLQTQARQPLVTTL